MKHEIPVTVQDELPGEEPTLKAKVHKIQKMRPIYPIIAGVVLLIVLLVVFLPKAQKTVKEDRIKTLGAQSIQLEKQATDELAKQVKIHERVIIFTAALTSAQTEYDESVLTVTKLDESKKQNREEVYMLISSTGSNQ